MSEEVQVDAVPVDVPVAPAEVVEVAEDKVAE